MSTKQIGNYIQLVSKTVGVDHNDNSKEMINKLPYNKSVWNQYIKPYILAYDKIKISDRMKIMISECYDPREIVDFRILAILLKIGKDVFSEAQMKIYLERIEFLTMRGSKREQSIKKYLEQNYKLNFVNVTIDEDKSGIDLKDVNNKTYQIKSTKKDQIEEKDGCLIVKSNCDMKLKDDVDILIVNETHNTWVFNVNRDIESYERISDDIFEIKFNKSLFFKLENQG